MANGCHIRCDVYLVTCIRSIHGPAHTLWWPGSHFANDFSIVIQLRWKFHPALIEVAGKWWLQIFHMARQLCCRGMCKILKRNDTMLWRYTNPIFHRIFITVENRSWNRPLSCMLAYQPECELNPNIIARYCVKTSRGKAKNELINWNNKSTWETFRTLS